MQIFYGQNFLEKYGSINKFSKRDSFPDLEKYLAGEYQNCVCVLYGLRRTGKTVMMHQGMMLDFEKSAYILCSEKDNLDILATTIENLWEQGIRKFFIDEVSLLPDFIDNGQFLADAYTGEGRIVFAGTDSLSFKIASHTSFSGRMTFIHTTYIPYHEHSRLLGTCSLDEYARCGGILTNLENYFAEYPLDAIALNIQHSVMHYKDGEAVGILKKLYEEEKLTEIIQKIVKDEMHRFSMDVLRKPWNLSDFIQGKNTIIRNSDVKRFSKSINLEKLLETVKYYLKINDNLQVDRKTLYTINQYLQNMELIDPKLILNQYDIEKNTEAAHFEVAKKLSWEERRKGPEGPWIFAQPGLRWAQIDILLKSIQKNMISLGIGVDKKMLDILFNAIRNNAMGHLMEDIIINETARSLNYEIPVFKYFSLDGEIDMVILDDTLKLYEIKHSSIPTTGKSGATKHIFDRENTKILENWFKRDIDFRGVLYCGQTGEKHGFYNAEEYLLNLETPKISMQEHPSEGMHF